jgi:hypothetical protein
MPYLSGRGLVNVIVGLVCLQLVALPFVQLHLHSNDLGQLFAVLGALTYFPALILAMILFLVWVHRATRNLIALGAKGRRLYTPEEAVWGFLVPIANLVRGRRVMVMLWTESQPRALDENGIPMRVKTTLVNWWWGLYLVWAIVLGRLEFGHGPLAEQLMRWALPFVVELTAALLFVRMLRATQARQDEQWDDLQRRAAPPQPTADALR